MDFLVSIAGKAAEYTVDPVAQQLSYLFKHKGKFQNLKIKVEELKGAGQRVKQSVHQANRNGEVIYDDVQEWLTKVNEKISEQAITQLEEDEQKAMKRCFAGFCPDFKSRYQLSKNAEKEANAIAQLLNQKGSLTEPISYRPHLECISTIRAVKGYEDFLSRKGAFDGVIAALEDDNVNAIGVYGMGGVGKTTLVKEVARQAKEKKLFGEVVLVAITQTPNMVNVQNEIAEKLDLKIEETSMDMRAARLRDRLKKETKVLIILDDLWVTLDLEALGIPSGDEHKGCKILMTSRRLDVLESMSSRPNLSIETLKEDEAWNLFKNMAGQIVETPDLQSTAVEVAKRCAGLPIAIATIAKALKHKLHLFQWKDALRQLSKPSERNFKGIPAAAYSAIELSYKFIETEELGPIFLLCSIMARDAAIEDLLRYAMGLGLFHDFNTVEETRDKVLTLVSNLNASCLLLDGSDPTRFELHDVVRDVALSIASRDPHMFALGSDDVFKAWPDEATMKNCKLISLQHAEVSDELLNHELECPDLTFFSMASKDSSSKIPDNFFKGMQRLKVLNLSEMYLSSLPSSIGSLKTLSTLCLSCSEVKDVAMIGELEILEILDLRGSEIAVLPEEIGQLRRLKLLDLSECEYLQVISPNVLSSLSKLEELYLYDSFDGWEVEGGIEINQRSNASLVELQHLSHLTTLEVHISDVQAIPKDNFYFGKLERYKISIGYEKWGRWIDRGMETSRMLKLKMNESIYFIDGVQMLLRKVESLVLDRVEDVGKMFYDQSIEGLPLLKHLVVHNVSDIKVVVNSKMVSYLESLDLFNLVNLETICEHGQLKDEFFGRLRIIKVENCQILKNLLSFSLAQMLCRQLEEMEVSKCENMTELFVKKRNIGGEKDNLEFTRLRILKLENLNRFNGLWYSEKMFQHATLLFDQKVLFPAMEALELNRVGGIEKIWPDNLLPSIVQNLTDLKVIECHKLKYVFTSSIVKSFVSLKTLRIFKCDEMEDIIEGILEGEEEEKINITVFSKLDSLELALLPKLKRFCCGTSIPIEFPFLRDLQIKGCDVLNTFNCDSTDIGGKSILQSHYLFNGKVLFPAMEALELNRVDGIEKIWHDNRLPSINSFSVQNLTNLEVTNCHKLKYVFTSSMVKSFVSLKTLRILYFVEMEDIIKGVLEGEEEEKISITVFPKLDSLVLLELPKLKRFFRGTSIPIEFPFLRVLQIQGCDVMNTFNCDSTNIGGKDILESHYLFNEKVIFPVLEKLIIAKMENLERLWPPNQLAEHSFSKLTSFRLDGCPKLLNAFPSSMLTRLQKLHSLRIQNCESVEEIVYESESQLQEGGSSSAIQSDVITTLEFPCLTFLSLLNLPNLKSMFRKMLAINWPSLEKIEVHECEKVGILFGCGKSSSEDAAGIPIQQPLFWVNQFTFPNLHKLILGRNAGMKEIWNCNGHAQQLLSQYLSTLKVVKLDLYSEEVTKLPSYLFHLLSLPTLQTLHIYRSSFKELMISQSEEGGDEKPACLLFSQITQLSLIGLDELLHLWKEKEGFQNLRILTVDRCPKLRINLVPSSTSFRNLTTLEVSRCDGIIKLITHSTAKSLVQLKEMSIRGCIAIEEIIENGDDNDDEISFSKLNKLTLEYLPKLESFSSSGNYTFGFPYLQTLIVERCPKMKMFSQRDSNTPMLHQVNIEDWGFQERWEGSLNSTLRELFREQNPTFSEEDQTDSSTS